MRDEIWNLKETFDFAYYSRIDFKTYTFTDCIWRKNNRNHVHFPLIDTMLNLKADVSFLY